MVAPAGHLTLHERGSQPLGSFAGRRYERRWGVAAGAAAPDGRVAGLERPFVYEVEYELMAPATGEPPDDSVLVDAENRGGPATLRALHGLALRAPAVTPSQIAYPEGVGNGFLFRAGISYARIQWQHGVAAVPADAQGVGLAIVAAFGRWLAARFPHRILTGTSQSAWFVNTFVAEGFNDSDARPVFGGALAHLSGGNWLAINQMAEGGGPQSPYVRPGAAPLAASALLRRPACDPLFVSTSAFTDYYRLRASAYLDGAPLPDGLCHVDLPAPHASGAAADPAVVFGAMGCNGGVRVSLNPIDSSPTVRALVVALRDALRTADGDRLPPSQCFALGPPPSPGPGFNALEGRALRTPVLDADAHPVGGVRLPEAEFPLGRPVPAVIPPAGTASITDVCANFGGWEPFSPAERARRYRDAPGYAAAFATALDPCISAGLVLADEREALLRRAELMFDR